MTGAPANILSRCSNRTLPLTRDAHCRHNEAQVLLNSAPAALFPDARHPDAALAGLLLLMGCWDESHKISQDIPSAEGSYWHAIAHRIEPDSFNSGYWFRRVGTHPIFPNLRARSAEILAEHSHLNWRLKQTWDPFLFIEWCDEARADPKSEKARLSRQIQQAEWKLLFDWCALPA